MRGNCLILIGSSPTVLISEPAVAVIEQWPEDTRPHVRSATIEQILADQGRLDKTVVAWLVLDEQEPPGLSKVLALLQEHHLPVLLSRPHESELPGTQLQDGVVLGAATTPPGTLMGMLGSLWCQRSIINDLSAELSIRRAHVRGVCDQINKIDEELRMAAQLQRELLPASFPDVDSVSFEVLYRPAGYVSGDIYDVFRLGDEHVGFFLADAMGHGVPAALITVYIKRSLQTTEVDPSCPHGYRIIPPDETLAWLNHDLIQQCGESIRIATACYGVINCRTLELRFSRAGHPYPLLLRAHGKTETITPDGGLLGVFPEETYEQANLHLDPGDRLLLYSDGLECAFSQSKGRSDEQASRDHLKEFGQGTLQDAMARLAHKLDVEAGSLHQDDDQTALMIGIGEPMESEEASYQPLAISG